MKSILVINEHYLPGYKGGGPVRSIANITAHLGDEFAFYILTRDRDLGDDVPYPNIRTDEWTQVGKARVRYLRPEETGWLAWRDLLRGFHYDAIYCNSFFAPLSVKTIFWHRLGQIDRRPLLIAPRGEFYPGALDLKAAKKRAYLTLANLTNLYMESYWQATNAEEKSYILQLFPSVTAHTILVTDVLPPTLQQSQPLPLAKSTPTRLIFLSRISRKKNLDYALRVLAQVKAPVIFDIYGPIEDAAYWDECQLLMQKLPDNITVDYRGPIAAQDALATFNQYHAFLFPTRGENFGYVIWEALYAGCLPILSDQTPWHVGEAGYALPLDDMAAFVTAVEETAVQGAEDHAKKAHLAQAHAEDKIADKANVEATRAMFARLTDA